MGRSVDPGMLPKTPLKARATLGFSATFKTVIGAILLYYSILYSDCLDLFRKGAVISSVITV